MDSSHSLESLAGTRFPDLAESEIWLQIMGGGFFTTMALAGMTGFVRKR